MENHRPDLSDALEPSMKGLEPSMKGLEPSMKGLEPGEFTPPVPPSRLIPPSRPIPPRVPPSAIAAPVRPGPSKQYRPPSQMTSQPVYIDRRILFGFLGGAVLLLAILTFWTNLNRTPAQVNESNLELRLGRDVRKNLSGADWATLSLPSTVPAGTLLKTGSDNRNVLAMTDGGSIRLDRRTSIKVVSIQTQGEGQKIHLLLYKGRVFISEGPDSEVSVETKFVNIVPVGTRFSVNQIEKKDLTETTTVQVVEGSVRMTHLEDTSANLIVKTKEQATAGAQVMENPKPYRSDDWISWNSGWTDLAKIPTRAGAAGSPSRAVTSGTSQPTPPPTSTKPTPPPPMAAPAPPPMPVPPAAHPPMEPPPYTHPEHRPEPPLIQPRNPRAEPGHSGPWPEPALPRHSDNGHAEPRHAPPPHEPPPLIRPDRPMPPRVHVEDNTQSGTFTADPSKPADGSPPPGEQAPGWSPPGWNPPGWHPPSGGAPPPDSPSGNGSVLDSGTTDGSYPTPAPESDRRLPGY